MTLFEKSTSMQIIPFPAHYQLGYHNFDFSSFSRISCNATVPIFASKCGSFANSMTPDEKTSEPFLLSEADFPFRLESFGGCVFVGIIRHYQVSSSRGVRGGRPRRKL